MTPCVLTQANQLQQKLLKIVISLEIIHESKVNNFLVVEITIKEIIAEKISIW